MRTLLTNSDNDLYYDDSGNLASASASVEAVLQVCRNYALAIRGEMLAKRQKGMPYFQVVFSGKPDIDLFEAFFKKRIAEVEGAIGVKRFAGWIEDGMLKYEATINTIYGDGVIRG